MLCSGLLLAAGGPQQRPFVVGHMDTPALRESSGIVESRKHPGVFWTHNDSGNQPIIYAIRRDGSLINQYRVDCVMLDWEDIAIDDDGHIYLGDIGNNGNLRAAIGVMEIDEPDPAAPQDPKHPIEPQQRWLLNFVDGARMDCESLFIWKGDGYLIKKSSHRSPSTVWKFSLEKNEPQDLQFVATLPIEAICTAADLSADGDQLAVMSTLGPYLFKGLGGDVKKVESIKPSHVAIEPRTNEGICFTVDGLMGTSESRDVYFFPWDAFKLSATKP